MISVERSGQRNLLAFHIATWRTRKLWLEEIRRIPISCRRSPRKEPDMKQFRLWHAAALLLICASALIGCAHHGGYGGGCSEGCPPQGEYGGGSGAPNAPYAPPGGGDAPASLCCTTRDSGSPTTRPPLPCWVLPISALNFSTSSSHGSNTAHG